MFAGVQASMVVAISGRNIISVGDQKVMRPCDEMVIARFQNDRKPPSALPDVSIRDTLAVATNVIATTACRRIRPAAVRLVGICWHGRAEKHGCSNQDVRSVWHCLGSVQKWAAAHPEWRDQPFNSSRQEEIRCRMQARQMAEQTLFLAGQAAWEIRSRSLSFAGLH